MVHPERQTVSIIDVVQGLMRDSPLPEAEYEEGISDGERWCRVVAITDTKASNISYTARTSVGGLIDFEVIDSNTGDMLFFEHVEAPSREVVATLWERVVTMLRTEAPPDSRTPRTPGRG